MAYVRQTLGWGGLFVGGINGSGHGGPESDCILFLFFSVLNQNSVEFCRCLSNTAEDDLRIFSTVNIEVGREG